MRTFPKKEKRVGECKQLPMIYGCPFFRGEFKGKSGIKGVKCRGGTLRFASAEERRCFVYPFCADAKSWAECSIAKNLVRSYERESKKENGKDKRTAE